MLKQEKQLFVRKTPIQLIHTACLDNYFTYEGRGKATMH
ncbi:hypothetical protein [Lentibacillus populi]